MAVTMNSMAANCHRVFRAWWDTPGTRKLKSKHMIICKSMMPTPMVARSFLSFLRLATSFCRSTSSTVTPSSDDDVGISAVTFSSEDGLLVTIDRTFWSDLRFVTYQTDKLAVFMNRRQRSVGVLVGLGNSASRPAKRISYFFLCVFLIFLFNIILPVRFVFLGFYFFIILSFLFTE